MDAFPVKTAQALFSKKIPAGNQGKTCFLLEFFRILDFLNTSDTALICISVKPQMNHLHHLQPV